MRTGLQKTNIFNMVWVSVLIVGVALFDKDLTVLVFLIFPAIIIAANMDWI